jgi:hypothetical protein
MSDSPDSQQSRASRDETRPRRKPRPGETASTATRSPVRRRRPNQLIQVAPEDLQRQKVSLAEVLQTEAKTGLPGLLVSTVLHAALLFILAMIAVRLEFSNETGLEFGWVAEQTRAPQNAAAMAPVQIQPITPIKPLIPIKTSQPKPDAERTEKQTRPVKPVNVSKALQNRSERRKIGKLEGTGSQNTIERAIKQGLEWLQRQQRPGGNWQLHQGYPDAGQSNLRTDTGATALALLAFLGDGHTHREGDYQNTVERGLGWLKGAQKPDGDFHDHTELGRSTSFYAHSMATIAICEAYAMTGDASLREAADAGITFLLKTQQPVQGGWRYRPQDEETMADMSVTGWGLMALHTARMAGIEVPPEAFGTASLFFDAAQTGAGSRYRYLPSDPSDKVTLAMTASGLVGRQWLGWSKDDIVMLDGVKWLTDEKHTPEWTGGRRNVYEWYYVAQVLHNLGGEPAKNYYNRVQQLIIDGQRRRGSRTAPEDVMGSWSPTEPAGHPLEHGKEGGRLYLTAMCLLILETPYRHASIYAEDE